MYCNINVIKWSFIFWKQCFHAFFWHYLSSTYLSWLRHLAHDSQQVDGLWSPQGSFYDRDRCQDPEEEQEALQRSIQTLQNQIAVERSRREAAERESELTARENQGLEQRLALLAGCRVRQKELEAEVEQLRLLWRAECANRLGLAYVWTSLKGIHNSSSTFMTDTLR